MTQGIRRGISLYSFQDDYFEGRRDLEGCIAAAAELGATGIETLGEQMMPGFPHLPESFYATYAGWMEKYGTVSVAHDLFLDTKKFKGRMMTPDEMVTSLRIDIDHTAKLGATSIRVIVNTPPDMVEAVAGYARDKGVKLGVEIHAPFSFDHPWIQQHLEVADRYPGTVGCVLRAPDDSPDNLPRATPIAMHIDVTQTASIDMLSYRRATRRLRQRTRT